MKLLIKVIDLLNHFFREEVFYWANFNGINWFRGMVSD
jgi:hypothetical protein